MSPGRGSGWLGVMSGEVPVHQLQTELLRQGAFPLTPAEVAA